MFGICHSIGMRFPPGFADRSLSSRAHRMLIVLAWAAVDVGEAGQAVCSPLRSLEPLTATLSRRPRWRWSCEQRPKWAPSNANAAEAMLSS